MPAHHITDITIENFRGFRKLELHGLKSINLIVGPNNTGKTSLLEAVALAGLGPRVLPSAFDDKNKELQRNDFEINLLHGNESATQVSKWLRYEITGQSKIRIETRGPKYHCVIDESIHAADGFREPYYRIEQRHIANIVFNIISTQTELPIIIIGTRSPSISQFVNYVGDALRKVDGENRLNTVMKKIDKRFRRVRIDPLPEGLNVSVDLGHPEMIPISQAGEGMRRAMEILSRLVSSRDAICMIDEVDFGIHHLAMVDLWRGLATISKELNTQLFVTTHSRDCIEAAYQAMTVEDPDDTIDFGVVQLYRVDGDIRGRVLGESHVEMAIETQSDLR
jgi:predicted ATP-dependent endonuclease of OLD family